MAKNQEKLFDMFPPISTQEWVDKINVDLKGADFNKKLVWRTNEGFNVQPFYRAEDIEGLKTLDSMPGQYPYVRGTRANNEWLVRQHIDGETPAEVNKKTLFALERGVQSISLKWNKELTAADLDDALKGVDLKKVEVNLLTCPCSALEAAKLLVAKVEKDGAAADFRGSVSFDPCMPMLKKGKIPCADVVATAKELLEVVKNVKGLRVFTVDSFMLCNAGSFITQELGYALAWGAQYMTMLTEAGVDATEVANRIKFNMGISSNFFMELAKFRAARMLWAEILKAYGVAESDCKMHVHAVTSQFNQTIYDAHVNLLRSCTESMSAALACVDSIETLPFDLQYKRPDEFSERIARNQQLMLREESHLDKVVDPAGGSYYVETLTVSIANVAWNLFCEVEEKGGFKALAEQGEVQKAVNESNAKRHTDVARRKEILLGTNQYPNFNETALQKIEECGCCCCGGNKGEIETLVFDRAASQFEALRLETERSGKRPKVFMLTIGNLAMRLARAQFSANFFGCAGYEIIDNIGFETVEDGVKAAMDKQADVVVLCSSDDEYAQYAPEAFKALQGKAEFVVAGAPACTDELKAQGIENFIHVRVNVLDTLKAFNEKLLK